MKRRWAALLAASGALTGMTPGAALAQTSPPSASIPTVMMVIDTSGSMAGSRLDQAKQALTVSVDALAAQQSAGLRSYAGSCGNRGILRTPLGVDNRDHLRSQIAALVAGGGTPTPDALLGAADDLDGIDGPRAIILVSDGQSTCGDPCPTAETIANEEGIEFKVHTVGFQAPEAAEGELACIAQATGGQYFPVDDAEGLAEAIGSVIGGTTYEYVAVGDSTTTGFSIPSCSENRATSPFGCVGEPPGTPYPEHVAADGGPSVDGLERVGIWGYTIEEAVDAAAAGNNVLGPWEPQLIAAGKATELVTVNIGINDMRFSDYEFWLGQCLGVKQKKFLGQVYDVDLVVNDTCEGAARARADEAQLQSDLDAMFEFLDAAKDRGAEVVITLYYNPFNEFKAVRFLPDRSCRVLHGIADELTGALNSELAERARAHDFTVVDLGPAFEGHGAGASDSYIWGSDCEAVGALTAADFDLGWPPIDRSASEREVQRRFDPHPNPKGTRAQADAVLEAIR